MNVNKYSRQASTGDGDYIHQSGLPLRIGFTLIELLVVIAIISLLAAILFPVFAKAREKARQIACASNLKQVGLAIEQYTQDNDETLPMRATQDNPPMLSWRILIRPYIKSMTVFRCPDNAVASLSAWDKDSAPPSYSVAVNSFGQGGAFVDLLSVPLAKIEAPSTTLAVVEAATRFDQYSIDEPGSLQRHPPGTATEYDPGGCMFAGHTGRGNFLFCDGHVKALRPLDTLDQAEGGTGTVNMWTVDGGPLYPSFEAANAYANLSYAQAQFP